jgi:hypothetical protein
MHDAAGRQASFPVKADYYYALLIKQRDCSEQAGDEVQIDQPAGRRRKIDHQSDRGSYFFLSLFWCVLFLGSRTTLLAAAQAEVG